MRQHKQFTLVRFETICYVSCYTDIALMRHEQTVVPLIARRGAYEIKYDNTPKN